MRDPDITGTRGRAWIAPLTAGGNASDGGPPSSRETPAVVTAARRPKRRADLVHQIDDGRRAPLFPGCWAVVSDPEGGHALTLAQVSEGPHYVHQDGHAIDASWRLHDGAWRRVAELTRLDLAGVLEDATKLLAAIRRGGAQAQSEDVLLRTHRAACLARRCLPTIAGDAAATLTALVDLDQAIADYEAAWRELVRVRLPNLARGLWLAGACELARRSAAWEPGLGRQHPGWYDISKTSPARS